MVIGHGDIASVLPKRDDLTFFASGVSNSKETDESEYQREKDLLIKCGVGGHIVYFSSLGVFYADSRYLRHKREMETLVKSRFNRYTIIRLGNISWGKNRHTIINYLKNKIQKNQPYVVEDTYRHIVSKEDFLYWIDKIPEWSCEMSITGKRMKVADIVTEIKQGKL